MSRFVIAITKNESGFYEVVYDNGTTVELDVTNYSDAVIEADALQDVEFDPVSDLYDEDIGIDY